MTRGRKRKFNPHIPKHIDQNALPKGIYFEHGRWYRREPCPEGGNSKKITIATRSARLSELHALMETANGTAIRGTVAFVFEQYLDSDKFKKLAPKSKSNYERNAKQVSEYKTLLNGAPLGNLFVDKLSVPVFQIMVDAVARTTPTKANHMLRFARRAFSWGVQRGHCKTNPGKGVSLAEERGEYKMPPHPVFKAVVKFARERGALTAHTEGSLSPYLAPAMELAYACRLRGIEVNTLTDADAYPEGILSNRRKGSLDNVTKWNKTTRAAWDELAALRAAAFQRKKRPIPMRASQRFLIVTESGTPLQKSSLDSAWQRLMDAAVEAKVITDDQRFTLHGLKHRGITDSTDKASGGHKSPQMRQRYDHEVPIVEPAAEREFSREFSRDKKKGT